MKLIFEKTFGINALPKVAQELKPIFSQYRKVMFKGEVGAGKTTLVKALAKVFGVINQVDSPTYSLVNEYEGEINIYHFDLYRLKGIDELVDIGWYEYIESPYHIWVEWPENAPEAFDDDFLLLQIIKSENPTERQIAIYQV